jgi:UDP-N-acetylglucosamine--N-acetylmuramyl-(pentapeptide) pyrophosphoryl-undecaprenol N-acetylglucosamine transferase
MQRADWFQLSCCSLCAAAGKNDATARRVIIAGGGTGGHLFPGIAIAREFMARCPENRVLFVSTANEFERSVLADAGFELKKITVKGIKGKGLVNKCQSLVLIPVGVAQSVSILVAFKPDLVVGVGSYAAGPVALAARLLGIPVVLHEQNILPGITNRTLVRFARRIYVSFEQTAGRFDANKVQFTGNPVRKEILNLMSEEENAGGRTSEGPLTLLIAGGSQGAHVINTTMLAALPLLRDQKQLTIIHQTGAADESMVREAYRSEGLNASVQAFFDNMDRQYRQADLVICRAGATTVAELTVAGKAVILIPFPFAADNHQSLNARALESAGAAEVIEQKDLTADVLANRINYYAANRQELEEMGRRAHAFGKPEAARVIVDDIYGLLVQPNN